ncbi:hypothetical protein [Komagataeibacter xylinus]|uniref:hypothetical protein n=1 Tax=Komagataeibacter xylinus TaxID=28448 RepID=UPI00103226FF|nr:hypothetical protein [Komagataeibacter xylinus]
MNIPLWLRSPTGDRETLRNCTIRTGCVKLLIMAVYELIHATNAGQRMPSCNDRWHADTKKAAFLEKGGPQEYSLFQSNVFTGRPVQ